MLRASITPASCLDLYFMIIEAVSSQPTHYSQLTQDFYLNLVRNLVLDSPLKKFLDYQSEFS